MTAGAGSTPVEETPEVDLSKLRKVRRSEYAIRFAFGAFISAVAAILGSITGYKLAGLFLGFPAILPATLTLLERNDGAAQVASDVRGAVFGAIAMVGFAIVAATVLPHSPGLALPAALATWVVAGVGIYVAMRLTLRALGERQYLPEVPASEAAPLVQMLRARGMTLALAESCTGGFLTALLTTVPGAGDVVRGSVVAYSSDAKASVLGVPAELIADRGAVSAGVARDMALRAKERFGADVSVAVTGLLGSPADGDQAGLTYIAVCTPDGRVLIRHYVEDHGPGRNRERDVRMALQLVREAVAAER